MIIIGIRLCIKNRCIYSKQGVIYARFLVVVTSIGCTQLPFVNLLLCILSCSNLLFRKFQMAMPRDVPCLDRAIAELESGEGKTWRNQNRGVEAP